MRVVVIGGGIVGASAAHHLATEGADVVLIDSADSSQATAAGGGVVLPGPVPGTSEAMRTLGARAAEHYPQLVDDLVEAGVTETGYARVGCISLAEEADLDQTYQEAAGLLAMPGMDRAGGIERLAAGEPAARFPLVSRDWAGVYLDGFVRVDGRRLAAALTGVAERRGAQLVSGTASLFAESSGITVVTDEDRLAADAVVVAAGAWSRAICRPLGVDLPVFPHRGMIVRFEVAGEPTGEWPVVRSPDWRFLLGAPGGIVVGAGTSEPDAGFDTRLTASAMRRILDESLTLGPGLSGATVAEVRVGFRPATKDGEPILGRLASHPEVVVATGLDTLGLTFGAYEGAVAADLALGLGERHSDLALGPFSPERSGAPA